MCLYALPVAALVHIPVKFINWLELCQCPFTVTFKYSQTKYLLTAVDLHAKPANIKFRENLSACGTKCLVLTVAYCTTYMLSAIHMPQDDGKPSAMDSLPCTSLIGTLLGV